MAPDRHEQEMWKFRENQVFQQLLQLKIWIRGDDN